MGRSRLQAIGRSGWQVPDVSLPAVHPGDVATHAVDLMLATGLERLHVADPQTGVLVSLVTRKYLLQAPVAATQAKTGDATRL